MAGERMPVYYLRRLTGARRTRRGNRHLARYLAWIAGAENAGAFLGLHHYTSHMSGVVAALSDDLATGRLWLFAIGLVSLLSFFLGAVVTTILIRQARERRMTSEYALPLLIEAVLVAVFSAAGGGIAAWNLLAAVALLCFAMGLQNAVITKLSDAVIRTTHVTGMVTDVGILAGRWLYGQMRPEQKLHAHEVLSLRLLASLIGLFFLGGVMGAVAYKSFGWIFLAPLAALLVTLAVVPVIDDLRTSL